MAGTLGALLWGWVVGLLVRSYVAAALGPVLAYVVIWLVPAYTVFDPVVFTGTTSLIGTAAHISGRAFVTLLALATCVALAAFFALRRIMTTNAPIQFNRATDTVGAATCAVGAIALFIFGPTGLGSGPWEESGPNAWNCRQVGPGSTACLPKDLKPLGGEYFTAMERADSHMRFLTGKHPAILYGASDRASAGSHDLFIYVDSSYADPIDTWAAYLVTYTTTLYPPIAESNCIAAIGSANDTWHRILEGEDVTQEEVRLASTQVAGC
jgi:hypothetical protein